MLLLFAVISIIVVTCAEVGPPPGGEEDRTAPFMVGSDPAGGATGVSPGNTVVIHFSERVVKPRAKKAVFISPRPEQEPELKWKSDRLIIKFADSFKTDQTYIVSLSSDIKDLRNNPLDSILFIAFSTGPTIDSGAASGDVLDDGKPRAGVLVALYDTLPADDTLPIDSVYPRYLTQSNKSGQFAFQYLPARSYYMVAFDDRTRDERFNPGREAYGVPDRPINLSAAKPLGNLRLTLNFEDTTTVSILSASYTADRLVRVRLSREIELQLLAAEPAGLALFPVSDSSKIMTASALLEPDLTAASTLNFYVGSLEPGAYRVMMSYAPDRPVLNFDSLVVAEREDAEPPTMNFEPDSRPQFAERLLIQASFSEVLDTNVWADNTFMLFDEAGERLPLAYGWHDPLRLRFSSSAIGPGRRLLLRMTEFELADPAGNVIGDSLAEYTIVTISGDSVGTVAGRVDIALPQLEGVPVILTFEEVESKQTFTLPVSGEDFNIELPAGKYLLSGFADSDSSGTRGLGSVDPYRYSETEAVHPDTVAVRARFETAGVIFKIE
ncbi:MAG: Ig-like domain-containing protein [Candidatus Zixiibacteriota bacterium]|nr:MAG: Ig-like domain-containing protein [candidate division Zixibacteria bacterium]